MPNRVLPLQRQVKTPKLSWADRAVLAALAKVADHRKAKGIRHDDPESADTAITVMTRHALLRQWKGISSLRVTARSCGASGIVDAQHTRPVQGRQVPKEISTVKRQAIRGLLCRVLFRCRRVSKASQPSMRSTAR